MEGDEWDDVPVAYHQHEVLKIHKTKFFSCPNKVITGNSWELIRQVNLCTNKDCDIIHLPEPDMSVLDQHPRFLTAAEIVRQERNSSWFHAMMEQWAKDASNG